MRWWVRANGVRILAFLLSWIIAFEAVGLPLAEAKEYETVWEGRRATQGISTSVEELAALPSTFPHLHPADMPTLGHTSKASLIQPVNQRRRDASPLHPIMEIAARSPVIVRNLFSPPITSKPPVILIQDVHLNSEAQSNVTTFLRNLTREKEIGRIGVEGAFGVFDFSPFINLEDRPLIQSLARSFLGQHLIGAVSFIGITETSTPPIFGVDDRKHYEANVDAYKAALPLLDRIQSELSEIRRRLLGQLASLPKELRNFEEARNHYHEGLIGFPAYVQTLASLIPDIDLTIEQFLQAYHMENTLDFEQADRERRKILERLSGILNRRDLSKLVDRSLAYRAGRSSFGDYFRFLNDLCEHAAIDLRQTPAFENYLRYTLLADGIDATDLFEAINLQEDRVIRLFARSQNDRDLIELAEFFRLAEKLSQFELTPNEWERYKSQKGHIQSTELIATDDLATFENFYEEADIRSDKMIENLLRTPNLGQEPLALITGGFHTDLMTTRLRKAKFPYIVISPRLTRLENEHGRTYLSMFVREKTPLEKLFSGSRLSVLPQAVNAGAPLNPKGDARVGALIMLYGGAIRIRKGETDPLVTFTRKHQAPVIGRVVEARTPPDGTVVSAETPSFPRLHLITENEKAPGYYSPIFRTFSSSLKAGSKGSQMLVRRPSMRESWFPLLPLVAGLVFGLIDPTGNLALISTAFFFAANHTNRINGRFDVRSFVIRSTAALGILTFAWGTAAAFGWIPTIPSSLAEIQDLSFVGLGVISLVAGLLHETWNAIVPRRFSLNIREESNPPEDRAGMQAHVERMRQSPIMGPLLKKKGKLTLKELNAIRLFIRKAFGLPVKIEPPFEVTEKVIRAVQEFEIQIFRENAITAQEARGEGGFEEALASTAQRLRLLADLYKRSEGAQLEDRIQESLPSDDPSETWQPVVGTYKVRAGDLRFVRLPVLATPTMIAASQERRRINEDRHKFEEAADSANFVTMGEALPLMAEDNSMQDPTKKETKTAQSAQRSSSNGATSTEDKAIAPPQSTVSPSTTHHSIYPRAPPKGRTSWRVAIAAILLIGLGVTFTWLYGSLGGRPSGAPSSAPLTDVAPKTVIPPSPALPPIWNASPPVTTALANFEPSAIWRTTADRQQTARADMLDLSMRVLALTPEAKPEDAFVAEIPQLARARGGVPIQTVMVGQKPHLLLDNGSTIVIKRTMLREFEYRGYFTAPPGRRFVTLDLSNISFPEVEIAGAKTPVARFANRPPLIVNGKRFDVPSIPIGIDGRPIVDAKDEWSRPRFYSKDRQPVVGMQKRGIDPTSGETVWIEAAQITTEANESDFRHYNRLTGNPLLFLRPADRLAQTKDDLLRLERKLGVLRELAERGDLVAVEINDRNEIINRYKNHDDVPPLVFYRRNPATLALTAYLPSDLAVDQSKEPDEIRRAVTKDGKIVRGPDGRPIGDNEILFTLAGNLAVPRAKLNAHQALTRAAGTWSTASIPTAAQEARAAINPVYMIVHDKVNGTYDVIPSKNITDFQLAIAGNNLRLLEMRGIPPPVIQLLSQTITVQTLFADGKITEYLTPQYRFITNDSPLYETTMLELYAWRRAHASLMAIHYAKNGTIQKRFSADVNGDDAALGRLLRNARRTVGNVVYLKDGSYIVRNTFGRVIAVQVSEDFRTRQRVFWSNNPADLHDLAALKARAPLQKNDFSVQVNFVDGAINPKSKNPLRRFTQNKTWIVTPYLGYEVDATGKVTIYHDALKLYERLYGRGSHRLQYVLADGTIVPWYEVTPADVVTEIRDPQTKTSIFTGSEWLRINYEIEVASMADQISRKGRNHLNRQVIFTLVRRAGISLGALTSYNPLDAARSEVERAKYLSTINHLAAQIEKSDLPPAQKDIALDGLRRIARDSNKGVFYLKNGIPVIIKSSDIDMAHWRNNLLIEMKQRQNYEQVLAAGGLIVTTNGEAYSRVSQLRQLYRIWGGDRADAQVNAFPPWVPDNAQAKADFTFTINTLYQDAIKTLQKAPPQSTFVVNESGAPVANAAQKEYQAYIADLRAQIPVKEKAWRDALVRLVAAVNKNQMRSARRDYFRLRLEHEILVRQIVDAEPTSGPTATRRQQYVRLVDHKRKKVHQHVTIITPPASAAEQLRQAEALAAQRKADLASERQVEEKGGVIVRGPSRSRYYTKGVKTDEPIIARWKERLTQILLDRVEEERRLMDQWAAMPTGPAKDIIGRQIEELRSEIEFVTKNSVFVWTEAGVIYVIEMKFGLAATRDQVAQLERLVAEAASARQGFLSGMVITRPMAGGVTRIETAAKEVEMRQKQLALEIEKARHDYDAIGTWLEAHRPDHPQAADQRERAKFLARQIRENTWYENAGTIYFVLSGFRGAQYELFSLLRENLRPDEKLLEETDVLGVPTGRSVLWTFKEGSWRETKLYEPYAPDGSGRARVKISPIVETIVHPKSKAVSYRTGGQFHIDTLETIQTHFPDGGSYTITRPAQRDTFRHSLPAPLPGHPDRRIETWTRTTFTYLDPNGEVVKTSTAVNFTREAGTPENTSVLEPHPVRTSRLQLVGEAPKIVDGNYVYDVVYGLGAGPDMNGQARQVHIDRKTGIEKKVFYPIYGPEEGEVVILTAPGIYEVRYYKNGFVDPSRPPIGAVRETTAEVNGGRVFVRTDKSGRFVRAYAVDDAGREVASFFHRPETVNGRTVFGRVVLEGNQTTADLAKLPHGRDIIAARRYPNPATSPLPVRQILYFDEDFNLINAEGQIVPKGRPATNPVAIAIQTGDRFDRGAPEYYPGGLPGNWTIVEELRLTEDSKMGKNRFFERARAVDPFGRERASIAALPNGRHLVEFLNPAPPVPGQPIRVTYTADYQRPAGSNAGVYAVDQTAISTTYLYERPFTVSQLEQANWVVDGGKDIPIPIREITKMVPQKAAHKDQMRRDLHTALKAIATELRAPGPLTLVATAVNIRDGGTSYTVRVKEDPFGRIVIFYSNENVIVNTAWAEGNATEGFEYAKGLTFRIEGPPLPITPTELLANLPNGDKPTALDYSVVGHLRAAGIATDNDLKLTRVTRYLRPEIPLTPGRPPPSETEYRKGEVRVDTRYIMIGDPLVRNYAVESAGFIRFIRWDDRGVSFGISGGEVVVNIRSQEIVRNTRWNSHDSIGGQYIYDVLNDPSDPRYVPIPEEFRKGNPDKIVFNYTTNMVYEVHSNEGYVVTSRDGFFLYNYHIDQNAAPSRQTVTGIDGQSYETDIPYWDERHPSARLYSEFTTRTWRSPEGDIYILISEEIVPGATEGTTPPTSYLIKNGQLVAKIVGHVDDPNAFVYTDLGGPESLWLDFYRKYYNSIPGLIANKVQSEILGEPTVRDIMSRIRTEGNTVELTTHRPQMGPSYNLLTEIIKKGLWIALAALLTITSLGLWLRFGRTVSKSTERKADRIFKNALPADALGRDPRARFAELELLGSPFVLPPNVPKENHAEVIKNYFRWNGFSEDEAELIAKRHEEGSVTFNNEERDLKAEAAVPPLNESDPVRQIYLASVGTYVDIEGKERRNRPYPPATVIHRLQHRGVITDEEIIQGVRTQSHIRGHKVQGALLWDNVMRLLVNQAQENVLRSGLRNPSEKALDEEGIKNRHDAIDKLPLSPEANVLRSLIHTPENASDQTALLSIDEIATASNRHEKFSKLVNTLLFQKIIDPTIDEIMSRTYAGLIADDIHKEVRQSVIAEILPFIHRNPVLLQEFKRTGDLTYNPYPMVKAIEPTTLREFILLKLVQLNPSQTRSPETPPTKAYHSVGQFAAMWPFSMYIVRHVNQALREGKTQEECLKLIDDIATTMILIVQENIQKFQRVTKRDAWRSPEEMTLAGIEAALKKRPPAAGILASINGELNGVISDSLRKDTILEMSRALDEADLTGRPREVDEILSMVKNNMERELNATDARIESFLDAARRELEKRISPSDRMKEIEPLFNGRPEAARLTQVIRDELDNADLSGELPDVGRILSLVVLSEQKLVDFFIELDLWDLFEFIQDKSDREVAEGRRLVRLEDEVSVAGSTTLSQLRSLAEGSRSERDDLTRAIKETTLALSAEIHPEATMRDRATKQSYAFRPLPFTTGVFILTAGAVSGYFGFVSTPTTLIIAAVAIVLLAASLQFAGTGLIALYLRIARAIASLSGFWNMNIAQRIGYLLSSMMVIGAAVALVWTDSSLFSLGLVIGSSVLTLLPLVWAGNFSLKERFFFGVILNGAGFYVAGLLTYHLFWKPAVIDIFTFGFFSTSFLLFLTLVPTVISMYHFMIAIRSYWNLNTEVWSDTARGLYGWRSLNPFLGFLRAFASERISLQEFRQSYLGIATMVYMVGSVASLFIPPLPLLMFSVIFFFVATVLYLALSQMKAHLQGDVADFSELTYTRWFSEFQKVERTRKPLLANGESVGQYSERLAVLLNRKFLLSDSEREEWVAAVRGQTDGRFVRPRSAKAQELIREAFNAISQRKPVPDVLALLQASSTHVQAAGELFTHTFENCCLLGTFNTLPDGRRTNLLGYVVRTHPVEWDNFLERVRKATHMTFGRTPKLVYRDLPQISETSDLFHLFFRKYPDEDFTDKERTFVIDLMMRWMNEMRPNNQAVVESMSQDIAEYHMFTAHERESLRDATYREAVEEMSLRHVSVTEAYRQLMIKHSEFLRYVSLIRTKYPQLTTLTNQELYDYISAQRHRLPNGSLYEKYLTYVDGLDDLGRHEIVFVEFYDSHQDEVETKLRGTFQDALLWGGANFTADTGGRNIQNVGPLQKLLKGLNDWAANLPDSDPVRDELIGRDASDAKIDRPAVVGIIPELKKFDPKDPHLTAADRAKFATMEKWSEEFLTWRDQVEPGLIETNGERLLRLLNLFSATTDEGLVPPADQKPDSILADSIGIQSHYNTLIQLSMTAITAMNAGVNYAFHDNRVDNMVIGKHPGIGNNLWRFFGRTVDYDAHVMVEHGQNAFRPFWATMNSQQMNPHYAAINPKMFVWASLTNAFPATKLYAIAQTVWTGDVQRALRGLLLDYGKYMGIPQTIGPFTPPGEDSQGLLMLQRSATRKGVFYTGTQIDWFTYRWGRPSLFAESLVGTEMRYAFNVTVFLTSRGSYAVFFNKNIPVPVKMIHLFLWMHHLIAPFALALLILLPVLSPFSAFSSLQPFLFFVAASVIFTEAININNLNRHWREQGNFWIAMWLTLVDLIVALPMFVSLIPFFFRGAWLAASEMFSFIRTVKEAYLAALPDWERHDSFMIFHKFRFGLPINALIGFAGVASWFVALLTMTPYGPIILLLYLMASLAMIGGLYTLGAFPAEQSLKGYRFELVSALLAFTGFFGWISALILIVPMGPLVWTIFTTASLIIVCFLAGIGFFHNNGIVRTAWVMQWDPLESTCRHASLSIL